MSERQCAIDNCAATSEQSSRIAGGKLGQSFGLASSLAVTYEHAPDSLNPHWGRSGRIRGGHSLVPASSSRLVRLQRFTWLRLATTAADTASGTFTGAAQHTRDIQAGLGWYRNASRPIFGTDGWFLRSRVCTRRRGASSVSRCRRGSDTASSAVFGGLVLTNATLPRKHEPRAHGDRP